MIITTFRIGVSEEKTEDFERKFKSRSKLVEHAPGFISFKLLKTKTDAGLEYILLTEWENQEAHENWVKSREHSEIHKRKAHQPLPGGITEVFEVICK